MTTGHPERVGEHGDPEFLFRMFLRGAGFSEKAVRRRPVIGIANSWSELNPCNLGLRDLAEEVKRGVADAGGLALEFPTISLGEAFVEPTSLYLRNLMAMDVEEMIAASPIDGVVLLNGCDKTMPAQVMGALSANKPAISLAAGPRPLGRVEGQAVTIEHLWTFQDRRRQGELADDTWGEVEGCLNGGIGTCNVMGTATTMAAIAEVIGLALPGTALLPAVSSERRDAARATGRRAVQLAIDHLRPIDVVTRASLENAFRLVCAVGGSTNALLHLEAFAGRIGERLGFDALASIASETPMLTSVKPAGSCFLSELEGAGGVPRVMAELAPLTDMDTMAASGASWAAVAGSITRAPSPAVGTIDEPVAPAGGLTLLRGTLAPNGAVIKSATADPRLRRHTGTAVVFTGLADLRARIDDSALDVDANSVLVLKNAGPIGGPGMSESGHLPIPAKLLNAGVTDMVRISDARMSGTASGTVVLHVAPEAAVGGPLALVEDGDPIALDIEAGTLDLLVDEGKLAERRLASSEQHQQRGQPHDPTEPHPAGRGYAALYRDHVLQADEGCDFDFLLG